MSRVPEAIDKLVDIWDSVLTDTEVIDGPVVTGAEPAQRMYVGYDADPEGDGVGASSDFDWSSTLGTGRRDEAFSVTCAIVVRVGDGTVKEARDAAYAVLALATATLLDPANIRLGFPSPTVAIVRGAALSYDLNPNIGLEARLAFQVAVNRTRI